MWRYRRMTRLPLGRLTCDPRIWRPSRPPKSSNGNLGEHLPAAPENLKEVDTQLETYRQFDARAFKLALVRPPTCSAPDAPVGQPSSDDADSALRSGPSDSAPIIPGGFAQHGKTATFGRLPARYACPKSQPFQSGTASLRFPLRLCVSALNSLSRTPPTPVTRASCKSR